MLGTSKTETVISYKVNTDLDANTTRSLEADFTLLSEMEQPELTLDMSDVAFIDSCGIGAIVFLYKRLKSRDRNLRLLNVNGQPKQLIQMLRIDKVIPLITRAEL